MSNISTFNKIIVAFIAAIIFFAGGVLTGIINHDSFGGNLIVSDSDIQIRVTECSHTATLYNLASAINMRSSPEHEQLLDSLSTDLLGCSMAMNAWSDHVDPANQRVLSKIKAAFAQACNTQLEHALCEQQDS